MCIYSAAGLVPPPSHLTSCTLTKCNLYLASSLETDNRQATLYKLLTFQVPNLISIFRRFYSFIKKYFQVRGSLENFVSIFFTVRGFKTRTHPLSFKTAPCYPSATAYSTYSQLTAIPGAGFSIPIPRTRQAVGKSTQPNI
jgi:hypothetical protein